MIAECPARGPVEQTRGAPPAIRSPFFPRTLLARTVLVIAALLVASQLAWFGLLRYSEREPRASQVAYQAVGIVNLTRAALIAAQPERRLALLRELSKREGIQVYPVEADELIPPIPDDAVARSVAERIRGELGKDTLIAFHHDDIEGLWVSFDIGGDDYWVVMPRARIERPFPWQWVGWASLVAILALAGGWLVAARVNRPLRRLADAAGEIGRGGHPGAVPGEGPSEVQTLAHAFNEMNADLAHAESERALLLAGVSHDLRTPLSRLRLEAEMLPGLDDRHREQIIGDIETMDLIVGQFLEFARGAEGETPVETDLNALVESATRQCARDAARLKLSLGRLPRLPLRPLAVTRLTVNLIRNALAYSEGEVEVRTGTEGHAVVFSVLDRGPGIPESETDRLRQPFTRLDGSRTGKGGSGLGLAIVDRIAALHGAKFTLRNRAGGGLEAKVEFRGLGNGHDTS